MAKFKILHTRKTSDPTIVEFEVQFISQILRPGDEFLTYDTHHPVLWKVNEILEEDKFHIIKCTTKLGLAWNDQFAGAIVDTEEKGKPKGYHHPISDKKSY